MALQTTKNSTFTMMQQAKTYLSQNAKDAKAWINHNIAPHYTTIATAAAIVAASAASALVINNFLTTSPVPSSPKVLNTRNVIPPQYINSNEFCVLKPILVADVFYPGLPFSPIFKRRSLTPIKGSQNKQPEEQPAIQTQSNLTPQSELPITLNESDKKKPPQEEGFQNEASQNAVSSQQNEGLKKETSSQSKTSASNDNPPPQVQQTADHISTWAAWAFDSIRHSAAKVYQNTVPIMMSLSVVPFNRVLSRFLKSKGVFISGATATLSSSSDLSLISPSRISRYREYVVAAAHLYSYKLVDDERSLQPQQNVNDDLILEKDSSQLRSVINIFGMAPMLKEKAAKIFNKFPKLLSEQERVSFPTDVCLQCEYVFDYMNSLFQQIFLQWNSQFELSEVEGYQKVNSQLYQIEETQGKLDKIKNNLKLICFQLKFLFDLNAKKMSLKAIGQAAQEIANYKRRILSNIATATYAAVVGVYLAYNYRFE